MATKSWQFNFWLLVCCKTVAATAAFFIQSVTVVEVSLTRSHTSSYWRSTVTVLYRFRDKAKCWSKVAIFILHLHSTPPLRGTASEFRRKVSCGKKLEWWAIEAETRLKGYVIAVSTHYTNVTHRQTNGQIDSAPWHRPRDS